LELIPENAGRLFLDVKLTVNGKIARARKARKAWEVEDALKLLARAEERAAGKGDKRDEPKGWAELGDAIRIGMFTGARIEEFASAKKTDVDLNKETMRIGSKTIAGFRTIPIHPQLLPTIKRLAENPGDYLFCTLGTNKYNKRSGALGKRFGRLKRELGYNEQYVFHSFRKTVTTMLDRGEVVERRIADYVGHETRGNTEGMTRYSEGSDVTALRSVLKHINYPGYVPR
jgi:integrase